MTATARRDEVESLYEELLSDDDLEAEPENDSRPQSTADLLEELGRIRGECGDFLRRYQQACGVRAAPRRRAPVARQPRSEPVARSGLNSADRRKAILHLLIEELIT
jgi:hypothetical protein